MVRLTEDLSYLGVTLVTESPALVLHEPEVGELLGAHLAGETLRVPGRPHRLQQAQYWWPGLGIPGLKNNTAEMLSSQGQLCPVTASRRHDCLGSP